jgi:aminomuconate-semialdehyde/2-hydroxymuconate-6-semialdehyde dehydrogenase
VIERPALPNIVGGQPVEGPRTFPRISPVDGSPLAPVHEADADVVDAAVTAARRALQGPWGRASTAERSRLLRRAARILDERSEEFVQAEVGDTGKPVGLARTLDVARAVANFDHAADYLYGSGNLDCYLTETADGRQALNYAHRKPAGVVAVIVPWNLPLLLLTWKVAPALAAGNAVVVKPSELSPTSATLLAEVLTAAGLPAGAYNVVHGFGPGSAGEFLTRHGDVDAITFTGESATGSAIMSVAAANLTPVSFELGGKNAALVFADADLDRAVDGTARSVFTNTGQVCLCTERVYVQRPVVDEFVARLVERAEALVPGRPDDPATTLGPLISREHREKVQSYCDLAVKEGATVLTGGHAFDMPGDLDGGAYFAPTVWTGLDQSARVLREEVFGPVCHVTPFDTDDEALGLANDSAYGLAATLWTSDVDRAHRIAQRLDVGLAWVNSWWLRDLRSPFGGNGRSGIGREGGRSSVDFYSRPTNVCVEFEHPADSSIAAATSNQGT